MDRRRKQRELAESKAIIKDFVYAIKSRNVSRIKNSALEIINSPVADQEHLDLVYSRILGLLSDLPELKRFALEVGRLKYGASREKGAPTVYDETAIMNDINASM